MPDTPYLLISMDNDPFQGQIWIFEQMHPTQWPKDPPPRVITQTDEWQDDELWLMLKLTEYSHYVHGGWEGTHN